MNDLTTKTISNSDLPQPIDDRKDFKLIRVVQNEPQTIPLSTTVPFGQRKKKVTIIGVILIAAVGIALSIILVNKFKKALEETPTETTKSKTNPTKRTTTRETIDPIKNNLVMNGDAETGPCAEDSNTEPPTQWIYAGLVTQISYRAPSVATELHPNLGPKNRGHCFFYGHQSLFSSMWQIINLTNSFDLLLNNKTLNFNLSAWIGGYGEQDDHAWVSATFYNRTMDKLLDPITIGPVFADERNNVSQLIFKSVSGYVPNGTYFAQIKVQFKREGGIENDGYIDNIALVLY